MSKHDVFVHKEIEIKKKMRRLKIYEKDIKEKFIRSSKPGGQNVNKVSTCVILTHVPTTLKVRCQSERTQAYNRHRARYLLVHKIEQKMKEDELKIRQERQKKKRQNRKRPQALKDHILEEKHKKSEKKSMRKKIKPRDVEDY